MIKTAKPSKRSKVNSTHLLSGFNIKKIITEELSQLDNLNNISDSSIIKIGRRPIFKINAKEKEERTELTNFPNKSFKIRSFTKKMDSHLNRNEDQSDIFQKVDCVRNLRAINNRIELFNISRISNYQRKKYQQKGVTANIYSKIREVFKKDLSVRCKVGSQVLIKETVDWKDEEKDVIPFEFKDLQTQEYREMANKIHVSYSNQSMEFESQMLLIVAWQAIQVSKRRLAKGSHHDQYSKLQKHIQTIANNQTLQILKLICSQGISKRAKIAFKVNDASSLQDLRLLLENNQLGYYSIFYPITKWCEYWNLYSVDALLGQSQKVILVDTRPKMEYQLPVLPQTVPTILIATIQENFVGINKTIQALQCFLKQREECGTKDHQIEQIQSAQKIQDKSDFEDHFSSSSKICILSCDFQTIKNQDNNNPLKTQKDKEKKSKLKINKEHILIDKEQIETFLKFVQQSRWIRGQKQKRGGLKQKNMSHDGKRRVLCQREVNVPEFGNSIVQVTPKQKEGKQFKGIPELIEELMSHAHKIWPRNWKVPQSGRQSKMQNSDKNDDLEDIMSHVNGLSSQGRSINQQVSEMTRRNNNIHRQILSYIQPNFNINLPSSENQTYFNQFSQTQVQKDEKPSCLEVMVYNVN